MKILPKKAQMMVFQAETKNCQSKILVYLKKNWKQIS
jgi:hypothetical protein